ncbi:MAG: hypothetical protein AB7E81_06480 [Hyphomicrobiaceae bacterium]
MLQSLFRRAEATVDNAIASVLARALVAIPFLVAAGFGTAALAIYVYDNLGLATGNLVLAIVFCVLGLITAAFVAARSRSPSGSEQRAEDGEPERSDGQAGSKPLLDSIDQDVMAAVASAAAPLAIPIVLRTVMRNLPLIAAIAAAGFILSRNGDGEGKPHTDAPMQPAE